MIICYVPFGTHGDLTPPGQYLCAELAFPSTVLGLGFNPDVTHHGVFGLSSVNQ
jgi:hypothetical protein